MPSIKDKRNVVSTSFKIRKRLINEYKGRAIFFLDNRYFGQTYFDKHNKQMISDILAFRFSN